MTVFNRKPTPRAFGSRLGAPPAPTETLGVTDQPEHAPGAATPAAMGLSLVEKAVKPESEQDAPAAEIPSPPADPSLKDSSLNLNFKVDSAFFWGFSDLANAMRAKKTDLFRVAYELVKKHPEEANELLSKLRQK